MKLNLRPPSSPDPAHPQRRASDRPGNTEPLDQALAFREVVQLLALILPDINKCTKDETAFVLDMQGKLNLYGDKTQITRRQLYYLRDIRDAI